MRTRRRTARAPLAERFASKVDRRGPDECWLWTASTSNKGYGQINAGGAHGPPVLAHRVAWELACGPVPEGKWVLHHCDNRRCCNPAHLFLGTHDDNMADMAAKGRSGRAKLTPTEVKEIRRRHDGRYGTGAALAREFGVCGSTISGIATGENWRHTP